MAEEIRNALVRVGGVRVASRTSTFQARRQGADLPAIGKLLGAGRPVSPRGSTRLTHMPFFAWEARFAPPAMGQGGLFVLGR